MALKSKKTMGAAIVAIIAATIALEGGYVNHPADPGGETNMGVTVKVARANGYVGPMRKLPDEIAYGIYYQDYIQKAGFEPLIQYDSAVVSELYDTGVNMGPVYPSRWFQQSLNELCGSNLTIDGKVGKATINTFINCQRTLVPATLCVSMLNSLDSKQKARYEYLVRVNPRNKVFIKGWITHRIGNVDRAKCKMKKWN